MSVTEVLSGLGSWELQLREATPQHVRDQLGWFGHLVVVDGPVEVEAAGDSILAGARYAGVCRGRGQDAEFTRQGSGLLFWLGDEDGKGHTLLTEVALTDATLAAAVTALLPPTVTVGIVHPQANAATRYTGKHIFQSRREALAAVLAVFDAELRVNPNFTVDVGTPAQLYNTEAPDRIIVRRGAPGGDIDLTAVAGRVATEEAVWDYSTDVTLLGQTVGTAEVPGEMFVTGSAAAPTVPYKDPRGNQLKITRLISESGETSGSIPQRTQLQLNRWNRVARSVKVTADDFVSSGSFRVGDAVYVYDPDSGIVDPAREVTFQGQVWHPDVVRVSGDTWPLLEGMTVAWRTDVGVWLDLTPWVVWENPGDGELTVGDLPKTLGGPGGNAVLDRVDAARDSTKIPKTPTGLALSTSSSLAAAGADSSVITATWTGVTQNTDNTTVALSHYEVQYRPAFRAPQWLASPITSATTADLAVSAALVYDVQVRAVSTSGKASVWSATASITSAKDSTAPAAPADPVLTNVLGTIKVVYPGTTSTGAAMPADAVGVDVEVGPSAAGPWTVESTLSPFVRSVHYVTAPYAVTQHVRLVAHDRNRNFSPPSAAVSAATAQLGDADMASLSVAKLTAGIMSADVVVGGRFTTALTGARVEHNALGFQGFRADNTKWLSLTPTEALITALIKTADPGNRRIEMGAGGQTGRIDFLAPDNTNSYITAFTATTGQPGTEAIRMAVKPADGTIWQGWGSLQVEGTGVDQAHVNGMSAFANFIVGGNGPETAKGFNIEWASDRGTTTANPTREPRIAVTALSNIHYMPINGFFNVIQRLSGGGTRDRIAITGTQIQLRDNTGLIRATLHDGDYARLIGSTSNGVTLQDSDGSTAADRFWFNSGGFYLRFRGTNRRVVVEDFSAGRTSPLLKLVNVDNFGATLYYGEDSAGTNVRLEVGDAGQTTHIPVWAQAFVVSSSEKVKGPLGALGFDALAEVRSMPIGTFQRQRGKDADGGGPGGLSDRFEVGTIAERAPASIQILGERHTPMVDHVGWTALNTAAIQQLAAAVDELRNGRVA